MGLSIYNNIRNSIKECIGEPFEKAVVFAHVTEGSVGGLLLYNRIGEMFRRSNETYGDVLITCGNVRETERLNGESKLWTAIIYIIDRDVETYELLYENDFDTEDLLHVEIGEKIEERFFPNMPYVSDDDEW